LHGGPKGAPRPDPPPPDEETPERATGVAVADAASVSIVAASRFNCDTAPGPISRDEVHNGIDETVGWEPAVVAFAVSVVAAGATLTRDTGADQGAVGETEAEPVTAAGAAGFAAAATHSPPPAGETIPPTAGTTLTTEPRAGASGAATGART
jgi:hypothetical protein